MTAAPTPTTAWSVLSSSSLESSPVTVAGPGGEGAPFGSGRGQHVWTDWLPVADPGVEEGLSERTCCTCSAEQIVPTDSLMSITALLRRTGTIRQEAA